MTARRLMNKKAYEEMVLLEKRCAMEKRVEMKPFLVLRDGYKEMFEIVVMKSNQNLVAKEIFGKDYKEVETELTKYLSTL
jgi:hypothetical protein